MTRGVRTIQLRPGAQVAAPASGLYLGAGEDGPVTVRAFRQSGTRLAAIGVLPAVQLLALRAASSGVSVRVITARPRLWQPLIAHGSDSGAVAPGTALPPAAGPSLVVDDRPDEVRRLGETVPWRCRIDVRTPGSAGDLRTLIGADLLLVGALLPELALAATNGLGVTGTQLTDLTTPSQGTVTVLRRGGAKRIRLDPSPDEARLLDDAT